MLPEAMQALPKVRVRRVPQVGHNVGGPGIEYVRTCIRDLLASELKVEVN